MAEADESKSVDLNETRIPSTTILLVFVGLSVIMVVMYLVMMARKRSAENKDEEIWQNNKMNIQKAYDEFHRIRVLEDQEIRNEIERQRQA